MWPPLHSGRGSWLSLELLEPPVPAEASLTSSPSTIFSPGDGLKRNKPEHNVHLTPSPETSGGSWGPPWPVLWPRPLLPLWPQAPLWELSWAEDSSAFSKKTPQNKNPCTHTHTHAPHTHAHTPSSRTWGKEIFFHYFFHKTSPKKYTIYIEK